MRPTFFHHLHPPTIPGRQARWRYTLGAGGTAVTLTAAVVMTGVLEMFYYVPTPAAAAPSVQAITYLVPFGGLVRSLHYWSAQLLVLVMGVHLARVVLTGSYSPPRRFNYLLGLALLLMAILLDFTGYILRWDQGIQWALVVGTNLIASFPGIGKPLYVLVTGGSTLGTGDSVLLRFYAWHVFGLTALFVVIGIWHLFRVRRDGGIAVPPPARRSNRQRIPRSELVRREMLAMMLTGAALVILSILHPAPISPGISSMDATTTSARAPWFFLWVQQLLKWGDPFLLGVLVPAGLFAALALIPYALPSAGEGELGEWFPGSNRGSQVLLAAITVFVLVLTAVALAGQG